MDIGTTFLIVAVCVVMEAFFSGSEIALISLSRHRLAHRAEKGERAALMLEAQFNNPARLYGTTSLGTNIFVFSGTAVMTAYLTGLNPQEADFWAVIVMAPITLLFGEVFPKAFFQRFTNSLSYIVIYPLTVSQKLFVPFLWIFTGIPSFLLGRGAKGEAESPQKTSQEEIRRLFSMGEKDFDLHPDEVKMIDRIFDFRRTTVEQCMIPLVKMDAVAQNDPIGYVKKKLRETRHSRLPVYSGRIYNITGIVSAFDALRFSKTAAKACDLARPAFYVFRKKKIADLLPEMQKKGVQMAVVVNEYSGGIGIVTREDLIEEIFGEIEDEYDEAPVQVKELAPNRWLADAGVEIDMLNEKYGWDIPVGDYETLAGYILTSIENIPARGDRIRLGDFLFTVKEAVANGIVSVEIERERKTSRG